MTYDFSTLNDKDLEELALDLLNAEYDLGLQSFKVGRDGGVDLRYSSPENNNEIVVQVKHYLKSGEAKLIKAFKEVELPKVLKLKPKRYIVITSIGLSKDQKDDLNKTFEPYILTSNDIFGKEDLNKLLRKHKDVEKKHFKLWFSSSTVLTEILNNAIEGRSRSYLQQIRNKIPLYVLTESFDKANMLLEKQKLLVITGMPGIGKTTLANVLLLEKARQNYAVYVINSIRDAEDVISINPDEKQIFYFDDFLGDVYYQMISGSQTESEINQFINRIVTEPNKYLILSTRTVILEQAKNKSEKIKRSLIDVAKYEIKLSKYSKYDKAKILYNHLYFKNVDDKYTNEIIADKFYKKIIRHTNYSPRLIEFFTDTRRISHVDVNSFRSFIIYNLEHPEEIWSMAIKNQIDYFERCFLYTLFTFNNLPFVKDVRSAYSKRLDYEIEVNNRERTTNQFDESVKNLMNGFIYMKMTNIDYKFEYITFINPSIADFLMGDLKKNEKEKEAILNSVIYLEQLRIFDKTKTGISLSMDHQILLLEKLKSNLLESLIYSRSTTIEYLYLECIVKYCQDVNYDEVFLSVLEYLNLENPIMHKSELIYALQNLNNATKSYHKIQELFDQIIHSLIRDMDKQNQALLLPPLFEKYENSYQKYIDSDEGNNSIIELVHRVVEKYEAEIYDSNKSDILNKDDVNGLIYEEVDKMKYSLVEKLNPSLSINIPRQFSEEEIEQQISINQKNEIEAKDRVQSLETYSIKDTQNENEKIEDLFYSERISNIEDEELPF